MTAGKVTVLETSTPEQRERVTQRTGFVLSRIPRTVAVDLASVLLDQGDLYSFDSERCSLEADALGLKFKRAAFTESVAVLQQVGSDG